MHGYVRPRLAAAASRLARGPGQPNSREGMPAACPVTADASSMLRDGCWAAGRGSAVGCHFKLGQPSPEDRTSDAPGDRTALAGFADDASVMVISPRSGEECVLSKKRALKRTRCLNRVSVLTV